MAKNTNKIEFEYDGVKGTAEYKDGRYYGEFDGKTVNHKKHKTFVERHFIHNKSLNDIGVEVPEY